MRFMKELPRRCIALILVIALSLPMLSGCAEKHKSRTEFGIFGYTHITVHDYSGMSESAFDSLFDKLVSRLEYYGKLFDIYYEYSGINNLRTVNLSAGEAVTVPNEIIELIEHALGMYELTGGEVNIAAGAVLRLWHDAREAGDYIPDIQTLERALEHCDIRCVEIDKTAMTVRLTDSEASLDVGAVAKGFAVEKLAEYAAELGAESLVIDVGGNLRTVGNHPSGNGWPVYIQNPVTAEKIKLDGVLGAAVTSGDYQNSNYYIYEGKKYHHIIDMDTLMPAEYFSSVSVICEDSGIADALTTALFCMPYESGCELLSSVRSVSRAVFITASGEVLFYES